MKYYKESLMSRTIVQDAEDVLGLYFPVLDNGFVSLVDYMGSDVDIEAAARVSYNKGTRKISDTAKLLRRLYRDKHCSPFEMVSLKFHLRMPLYIIQQLLRHRTAKLNQESFRYSEIQDDFQKTKFDAWRLQAKDNKQGSCGYVHDSPDTIETVRDDFGSFDRKSTGLEKARTLSLLEESIHSSLKHLYKKRLDCGVAREQARKDIPVSTYSSLYWKCDLRNLLHLLELRVDSHAQQEIREYANVMAGLTRLVAPISFQAWIDYSNCAKNFSRLDIQFLNELTKYFDFAKCEVGFDHVKNGYLKMISSDDEDHGILPLHERIGMVQSELDEFWKKLIPVKIPDFSLDYSKAYIN